LVLVILRFVLLLILYEELKRVYNFGSFLFFFLKQSGSKAAAKRQQSGSKAAAKRQQSGSKRCNIGEPAAEPIYSTDLLLSQDILLYQSRILITTTFAYYSNDTFVTYYKDVVCKDSPVTKQMYVLAKMIHNLYDINGTTTCILARLLHLLFIFFLILLLLCCL